MNNTEQKTKLRKQEKKASVPGPQELNVKDYADQYWAVKGGGSWIHTATLTE